MKKILKIIQKIVLVVFVVLGGCFMYFVGVLWCGFYQEHKSFAIGMQNVEGARVNAERTAKQYEIAEVERQGTRYEEEGKYDLAIGQYKKALTMKVNNLEEWVLRCALADVYTKSNQDELALEEVNWIISQNPREQVKKEYLIRKQLLEKIIESKKRTNVPNLGQTALLFHRVPEIRGK